MQIAKAQCGFGEAVPTLYDRHAQLIPDSRTNCEFHRALNLENSKLGLPAGGRCDPEHAAAHESCHLSDDICALAGGAEESEQNMCLARRARLSCASTTSPSGRSITAVTVRCHGVGESCMKRLWREVGVQLRNRPPRRRRCASAIRLPGGDYTEEPTEPPAASQRWGCSSLPESALAGSLLQHMPLSFIEKTTCSTAETE